MKTIFTIMIFAMAVALSGCAAIKERKLADDIQNAVDVTETICTAANLFASQGMDVPGVEQCDAIIPQLSKDEIKVAIKIVQCRDDYPPKEVPIKFTECAGREGWPTLKATLKQLAGK